MEDLQYFSLHRLEVSYVANASVSLLEAQASFPSKVPTPSLTLSASAQLAVQANAFYSSEAEKETVVIHDVSYLRSRRVFIEPGGTVKVVDKYLSSVWSIEAEHRNK